MPKFLFSYHGGMMPDSPEEVAEHMAAWDEWFAASGAAFVDLGAPCSTVKTVSSNGVSDGGGENPVSGYGLVEAADIDAAAEIARGCPIVVLSGGSVEVGETFEVNMG